MKITSNLRYQALTAYHFRIYKENFNNKKKKIDFLKRPKWSNPLIKWSYVIGDFRPYTFKNLINFNRL